MNQTPKPQRESLLGFTFSAWLLAYLLPGLALLGIREYLAESEARRKQESLNREIQQLIENTPVEEMDETHKMLFGIKDAAPAKDKDAQAR